MLGFLPQHRQHFCRVILQFQSLARHWSFPYWSPRCYGLICQNVWCPEVGVEEDAVCPLESMGERSWIGKVCCNKLCTKSCKRLGSGRRGIASYSADMPVGQSEESMGYRAALISSRTDNDDGFLLGRHGNWRSAKYMKYRERIVE